MSFDDRRYYKLSNDGSQITKNKFFRFKQLERDSRSPCGSVD